MHYQNICQFLDDLDGFTEKARREIKKIEEATTILRSIILQAQKVVAENTSHMTEPLIFHHLGHKFKIEEVATEDAFNP